MPESVIQTKVASIPFTDLTNIQEWNTVQPQTQTMLPIPAPPMMPPMSMMPAGQWVPGMPQVAGSLSFGDMSSSFAQSQVPYYLPNQYPFCYSVQSTPATTPAAPPVQPSCPQVQWATPAAPPVQSSCPPVQWATPAAPPVQSSCPPVQWATPAAPPVQSSCPPVQWATPAAPPVQSSCPPVQWATPAAPPVQSSCPPVQLATPAAPPVQSSCPPVQLATPAAPPVQSACLPVQLATPTAPPVQSSCPPVQLATPAAPPVTSTPAAKNLDNIAHEMDVSGIHFIDQEIDQENLPPNSGSSSTAKRTAVKRPNARIINAVQVVRVVYTLH